MASSARPDRSARAKRAPVRSGSPASFPSRRQRARSRGAPSNVSALIASRARFRCWTEPNWVSLPVGQVEPGLGEERREARVPLERFAQHGVVLPLLDGLRRRGARALVVGRPQEKVAVGVPGRLVREVRRVSALVPVERGTPGLLQGGREVRAPLEDDGSDLGRVGDRVGRMVLADDVDRDALLAAVLLDDRFPVTRQVTGQRSDVDVEAHAGPGA